MMGLTRKDIPWLIAAVLVLLASMNVGMPYVG